MLLSMLLLLLLTFVLWLLWRLLLLLLLLDIRIAPPAKRGQALPPHQQQPGLLSSCGSERPAAAQPDPPSTAPEEALRRSLLPSYAFLRSLALPYARLRLFGEHLPADSAGLLPFCVPLAFPTTKASPALLSTGTRNPSLLLHLSFLPQLRFV